MVIFCNGQAILHAIRARFPAMAGTFAGRCPIVGGDGPDARKCPLSNGAVGKVARDRRESRGADAAMERVGPPRPAKASSRAIWNLKWAEFADFSQKFLFLFFLGVIHEFFIVDLEYGIYRIGLTHTPTSPHKSVAAWPQLVSVGANH